MWDHKFVYDYNIPPSPNTVYFLKKSKICKVGGELKEFGSPMIYGRQTFFKAILTSMVYEFFIWGTNRIKKHVSVSIP